MDEPRPGVTPSTTLMQELFQVYGSMIPGLIIGAGVTMLMLGVDSLWRALDPNKPEDPFGIPGRGLWKGSLVVVLAAVGLAVGCLWLRALVARGVRRKAMSDALLGVIVLSTIKLVVRSPWPEAVAVAVSVGIVLVIARLTSRRTGGARAEPGAAADSGA